MLNSFIKKEILVTILLLITILYNTIIIDNVNNVIFCVILFLIFTIGNYITYKKTKMTKNMEGTTQKF